LTTSVSPCRRGNRLYQLTQMNYKDIFWGVLLIVTGAFFAIRDLTDLEIGKYFWPVVFITAGCLLLIKNNFGTHK
jgi:hypothetical protein